jgi:CO/xanthine dehydrogenase FAD-binding subunit
VYVRPRSIDAALAALAGGEALPVCGGTDVCPAHVGRPITRRVVDVSAVAGLRGIHCDGTEYRIGGGTTWSDIQAADLPPAFDGLKAAAREVGAVQIQNRGTIAGNLCNASPAADGVPPLLTLDAEVELRSVRGRRVMPVSEFITGYRRTALLPDELLSAVLVRPPAPGAASGFFKLGARRYLVISILMAAAVIERDEQGRISHAAVAVGAASPVAQRLEKLEHDLVGLERGIAPSSLVSTRHVAGLSPIDDVRATAAYRLEVAITVVGMALDRAAGGPSGG